MKLFRVAALCAALFVAMAAVPAIACAAKEDLAERIAQERPDATVAMVGGEATEKIAIGIAQLTGGGVPTGGEFALIDLPESNLTYIVRFADDCATHHGRFPTALVQSWIAGLAVED